MGMPAANARRWTYEEVLALIDEQEDRSVRYEFVDGALLVTPSPGGYHQRIILELFRLLDPYVRRHGIGEVRLGPSEVMLLPTTVVQPDLFVVPSADGRRPRADAPVGALLLAVEVLSPGSRQHDRLTKRHHYRNADVPEYWIVDQEAAVVERWRPNDMRPEVLDERLLWQPLEPVEALSIDLPSLFRSVLDE